jgi:homogentisate 1,2-dioxygenase
LKIHGHGRGALNPRRVADTAHVAPSDLTDPRSIPEVMLSNADASVAISRRRASMPFAYRNTDGDLLYFVHKGAASSLPSSGAWPTSRATTC